jgi:tetratricopeptide (TPR) repeat protein
MKPFCFVLMPFGTKVDDGGRLIDFDRVYRDIIVPACQLAELDPIRADEEAAGGFIHKPMFERLMLCDYAVADLTTANPNVFYELGVRHGIRPYSTVVMFGKGMRLPFDLAPLRGLPYTLDAKGAPETPDADRDALAARLRASRDAVEDSPLFQLITDWPRPQQIARLKTDTFRDVVEYSRKYKDKLREARVAGPAAVAAVERELNVRDADPAVVIDLFLSYRAVKDWAAMLALVARMSPVVARTVMVREQQALALNRLGRRDEAQEILDALILERGPSSETNGILGRVYKDRWEEAAANGQHSLARGHLRKAIDTYLAGFESDWRDAYPGVNAVTLMELDEPVDPRQADLLPVVRYAMSRRLASSAPDYWDHATRLELSVITADRNAARDALSDALASIRESFEPETTSRNIGFIRAARERRGLEAGWIAEIERELQQAAASRATRARAGA